MTEQINPFHILSGQVAVTRDAVYHFDGPGNWMIDDYPMCEHLHRLDGPAIERASGNRYWYLNGQRHRTDGPAVEWADGSCEWWINGVKRRTR